MEIVIINGSLLEADADVIVNAANSLGVMGGGVAEAIKKAGGDIVEEDVKNLAPIAVGKATKAALRLADEHGFSKIALPGMGTGIGGVKKEASAHAMIEAIQDFKAQNLKKIILIDVDEEMVSAWRGAIAGKIER